jgi:glycosyltransferase involved in cell wall biosynthesis
VSAVPSPGGRRRLSLIVPAYNEVEGITELVAFSREVADAAPELDVELVVVDDGSTDGTSDAVAALTTADDNVVLVTLSRNFGSHAALSAGLRECSGDAALTLSADRQEPLSAVLDLVREWCDGADIVWGLRSTRAVGRTATGVARGFSAFLSAHSDVPSYPGEGPSQVLLDRRVIEVLNAMPEGNRNLMGMVAWVGFDQRRIHFEQLPRPYGTTKWTSRKKAKLVVDSFVQFSDAPIRWITVTGLVFVAIGVVLLLVAIVAAIGHVDFPVGFTVLSGLVVGLGGGILGALGIVGEYVWRAGYDARRRPNYVVRRVLRRGPAEGTPR